MIKIKVCGITRLEDAKLATELGAWAIGFIFVKDSPRYINPESAAKIIEKLPKYVEKVGVFANSSIDEIEEVTRISELTKIQLHGDESNDFCTELINKVNLPIIKAIRILNISDIEKISNYKDIVNAILLDSYSEGQLGGTGKAFNWTIAEKAKLFNIPIILAGGIKPDNIKEAYKKVYPFALDVSSSVEKDKGIKDHNKLKKLFLTAS